MFRHRTSYYTFQYPIFSNSGERGCIFINNDNSFKTLDGSINDCLLLPDGVHLKLTGTERLAKSLGVDKHARCVTSRPASQNIQRKDQW